MNYMEPQPQSYSVKASYKPPNYYVNEDKSQISVVKSTITKTPQEKYDFEAAKIHR